MLLLLSFRKVTMVGGDIFFRFCWSWHGSLDNWCAACCWSWCHQRRRHFDKLFRWWSVACAWQAHFFVTYWSPGLFKVFSTFLYKFSSNFPLLNTQWWYWPRPYCRPSSVWGSHLSIKYSTSGQCCHIDPCTAFYLDVARSLNRLSAMSGSSEMCKSASFSIWLYLCLYSPQFYVFKVNMFHNISNWGVFRNQFKGHQLTSQLVLLLKGNKMNFRWNRKQFI